METIWITGASGYSGRFLASFIKTNFPGKFSILGISRKKPPAQLFDSHVSIDLSETSSIDVISALPTPKKVFHLSGVMPPANDISMWMANVCGTVHLLKALSTMSFKEEVTVVNVGSAAEYSRKNEMPLTEEAQCPGESPYGMSKWAQTKVALGFRQKNRIKVLIARTFNIIGPSLPERLIGGTILKQIRSASSKIILRGNVRAKRDFIDINDVVRAYWVLSEKGKDGHIYNVCSGAPVGIMELVELFFEVSGCNKEIEWDETLSADDSVYGSFEKIKRETGWEPSINIQGSIKKMI